MGFLQGLGAGLKKAFDGKDWGSILSRAGALRDGDWAGAARITQGMADNAASAAQSDRVRKALKAQGYSDDEIALAMTNPQSIGANFNRAFRSGGVTRATMPIASSTTGPQSNLLYHGFRLGGDWKDWDPAGLNR